MTRAAQARVRGYFGVAAYHPKTETNIGGLWRSAHVFGASYLAVIGHRYRRQHSDVTAAYRHVPLFEHETAGDFLVSQPRDCQLVAVELSDRATSLVTFAHPARATYLLGPEDGSIPDELLDQAHHIIQIPTQFCLNLASCGTVVLYDRVAKALRCPTS